MNKIYTEHITKLMGVNTWQVEHCIELFEEGATIPFISRYRKERTGGLDEVQVTEIKHYFLRFTELEKRKSTILKSIQEQDKLTDKLKKSIEETIDENTLEDLYLPYKPKRRTKASVARELGLEPLARDLFELTVTDCNREADKYLSEMVGTREDALSGARDIIAEWVSETVEVREKIRDLSLKKGVVKVTASKGAGEEDNSKFANYFDFSQSVSNIPAHRLLAILRGEKEGELSVKLDINESEAFGLIKGVVFKNKPVSNNKSGASIQVAYQVEMAVEDSYKRLLAPSVENEVFKIAKAKADLESVKVFGENLSSLLLAPPVGQKRVLAIDPGFRTGCKIVCLDAQGELLHNDTIFPHPPQNEKITAMKKISNLVEAYKIEVIAIGDGTAGRETESFIKRISLPQGIEVYSVSEDGASVYSASESAREELPDYDVTVRGAVSIGRRAMDPLAELVKIDPKSLGVGQYQHDVDQKLLKEMLDTTVESCVSRVGVNLNTASKHLLGYVSGIGPSIAKSIVEYRALYGPFKSRFELKKVKRLGEKVFEQCAGFLRIPGSENPLDNSAVHPERYELVRNIATDMNCTVDDLIRRGEIRKGIDIKRYISEDVGVPTLTDILEELSKPGRDPREKAKVFEFSSDIQTIEDIKPGMILKGIVTNITNFGAFVDIGIKQDGLVHISQISDRYVSNPAEVIKLQQHVRVRVVDVDYKRGRIQLSMKNLLSSSSER
ncbi:MAG: Tex family protein [Bacteroidales bacterium]|nr:RNA-binding transcriptional accessory protein [Bacteroidales bacterium]MDD2425330.1 Tex family protein [Bacteroidales bacterium]MDD3989392.1 Tex family protein [Bacteroidales bacterium]MDD4639067.1 Tex family protein [Bacteroidales bacterium]